MNKLLILTVSILILSCSSPSKEVPESKSELSYQFEFAEPSEVGLSIDSLKKIDEVIKAYVDSKRFPGAVVLVAKNGKIVYETQVGWSDSAQTEPYRKDHIFRMASMTKPFTSVAAMKLFEEGKLDLDDPVSKYIPEFSNPMVMTSFNAADTTWESRPANNEPTVRNLLSQTAGVPYGFINPPVYGAILAKSRIPDLATHLDVTIEEKMAILGTLPLAHDPGENWMYGLNTDVLGRVVEVASGMSLAEYIKTSITDPIGIEDMNFFLDKDQEGRLVDVFVSQADSTITLLKENPAVDWLHPDYPVIGAKKYYSGGSGMSGTARDYFMFGQMMLNDGKFNNIQILKPETAQMMHQDQIDSLAYPWGPARFGFGFDVADGNPVRPDGTYSWGGAFSTTFWIDPENEIVAVLLSQVLFAPDRGMNNGFEKAVYSSIITE